MAADYFLLLYTVFSVVVTVCGNGAIIICWICDKSVRTSSNTLLVALAVFDFLTGAVVTPIMYGTNFNTNWTFGRTSCQIYIIFIYSLFILVSNILVLIAVDRYRLLVEGVPYIQRRSPLTAIKPLALIVFIACWLQIDTIVNFNDTIDYVEHADGTYTCARNYRPTFGLLVILLDAVLPGVSLICINMAIYRELKKRNQDQIHRQHGTVSTPAGSSCDLEEGVGAKEELILERQRSAAVTLTILTVAFIVLLLPYITLNLIRVLFDVQFAYWMKTFTAYSIWANSLVNPFVYAIRCNDFKQSLLTFKKKLCNKVSRNSRF